MFACCSHELFAPLATDRAGRSRSHALAHASAPTWTVVHTVTERTGLLLALIRDLRHPHFPSLTVHRTSEDDCHQVFRPALSGSSSTDLELHERDLEPSLALHFFRGGDGQLHRHRLNGPLDFGLRARSPRSVADQCGQLCPTVQPLLDQLEPFPACVLNDRLDLLAFNRVYASFFEDLESIPVEERNLLWLTFTSPAWRRAIVDWDDSVGRMVAEYRAAMAHHLDEPAWKSLVSRLQRESPEFTAFWERHDVQRVESRKKRALHPSAGLLTVEYTNMWLGERLGTRIVAFTPADARTRSRLEALHASLAQPA